MPAGTFCAQSNWGHDAEAFLTDETQSWTLDTMSQFYNAFMVRSSKLKFKPGVPLQEQLDTLKSEQKASGTEPGCWESCLGDCSEGLTRFIEDAGQQDIKGWWDLPGLIVNFIPYVNNSSKHSLSTASLKPP